MKVKELKFVTKRKAILLDNLGNMFKSDSYYIDVEDIINTNGSVPFIGWVEGSEKEFTEEFESEEKYLAVKDEFDNTYYVREEVYTHDVNKHKDYNCLMFSSDFAFDNKGKIIKCRHDTADGFMRTLADNYFGVKYS